MPGDERFLFLNCVACAKMFAKKCTKLNWKCPHNDKERSFTWTGTTIELEEALKQGYRVDRFYRAWNYKKWDDNLFKGYVKRKKYRNDLDIDIDLSKVELNSGLRYIAKICLNSLWGKFGRRNSLSNTVIVDEMSEYFDFICNPKLEVQPPIPVSSEVFRLVYKNKNEFVEEHKVSNIVVSLWTTSAARLRLYKYMRIIADAPGCRLLYTDTDSCIFEHPIGANPIPEGEILGEMTKEFNDKRIVEYVAGGAKQYGLKMLPKGMSRKVAEDENYSSNVKIRGITLDAKHGRIFQYKKFKEMVLNYGSGEFFNFTYTRIKPDKDSKVTSRKQIKKYNPIMQKGIIDPDTLIIYPFGYLK